MFRMVTGGEWGEGLLCGDSMCVCGSVSEGDTFYHFVCLVIIMEDL
jgi:hypothetical protein